jgi:hypothetical protein
MSSYVLSPTYQGLYNITGTNVATFFGSANNVLSAPFSSGGNSSMPYLLSLDGITNATISSVPILTYVLIGATTGILAYVTASEYPELINGMSNSMNSTMSSVNSGMNETMSSVNNGMSNAMSSVNSGMSSAVSSVNSGMSKYTGNKEDYEGSLEREPEREREREREQEGGKRKKGSKYKRNTKQNTKQNTKRKLSCK